jgi:predicted metal-dependent peptidase
MSDKNSSSLTGPGAYRAESIRTHEPMFPPNVLAEADKLLTQAFSVIGVGNNIIGSLLLSMCHKIPTSACDTFAVTLDGSGIPFMMYNPEFLISLEDDKAAEFILSHEAFHVILRHLHVDSKVHANPAWTMATETVINHLVQCTLGTQNYMPKALNVDTGKYEPTGVNPDDMYKKYRDDLKSQGLDPVSRAEFLATDLGCMTELSRMKKLPGPPVSYICVHASEGGEDGIGTGSSMNQEAVDEIVGDVLDSVMRQAIENGATRAKEAIQQLAAKTGVTERTSKIWGELGLGALLGEQVQMQQTDFWAQWVEAQMASRVVPGERLMYPRKMTAVAEELNYDLPLIRRGDDTEKTGIVVCDTSGSMHSNVLEFVRQRVGDEAKLEVEYLNFDSEVYLVEDEKPFCGGGGTDVQCVLDYVDRRDEEPDFVLVITDGYMRHRVPSAPDKWVWLITPGGDKWPEQYDMATRELPTSTS